MIARGSEKERFKFYLVKKPRFELISFMRLLKTIFRLFKFIFGLICILLSCPKEKALYNMAFTEGITGGVV